MEYQASAGKTMLFIVVGSLVGVIGLVLAAAGLREGEVIRFAGGLAVGGLLLVVLGGILLVRRGPALVLTEEGLEDRSTGQGLRSVPWSNVAGAHVTSLGVIHVIDVQVHDMDAYLAGLSGLRKVAAKDNFAKIGAPLRINVAGLAESPDAIAGRINMRAVPPPVPEAPPAIRL